MKLDILLKRFLVWPACGAVLFACGGDETTISAEQVVNTPLNVVADVSELPVCDKSTEGQMFFVTHESTIHVCAMDRWMAKGSADNTPNLSCFVDSVKTAAGEYKVVCNGDSVGVVASRSAAIAGDDEEDHPVDMTMLKGYSQKGPFVRGSSVYLYELENSKTLKQSSGNFITKIISNKGDFQFTSRSLMSQYVLLQAVGYYYNEITAENTDAMLTLYAITDVSHRQSANINVLTHLEYPRVVYLVTHEKMKFRAAKKLAREEILRAFHIPEDKIGAFEDLNMVFDEDEDFEEDRPYNEDYDFEEGSVAWWMDWESPLVQISGMLQGELSVAQLTERLSRISQDIEEDGTWDDIQLRQEIANWIASGEASTAKYSGYFWHNEFGIEERETLPEEDIFVPFKNTKLVYDYYQGSCSMGEGDECDVVLREARPRELFFNRVCAYNKLFSTIELEPGKYWTAAPICRCDYGSCDWDIDWKKSPNTLLGTFKDERDGNVYAYTTIGNQVWMAQNLRFKDPVTRETLNFTTNCNVSAGCYYNWYAMMDGQNNGCSGGEFETCPMIDGQVRGICPEGWHIPDDTEWDTMLAYAKSENPDLTIEQIFKSEYGWEQDGEQNGKDVYGFSFRNERPGDFLTFTRGEDRLDAAYRSVVRENSYAGGYVRCVKDAE